MRSSNTTDEKNIPEKLLGKPFGAAGLQIVLEELASEAHLNRAEIARRVCRRLNWKNPGGQYQFMSARVALLQLHRQGHIYLPAPTCGNGNGKQYETNKKLLPPETELNHPVHLLANLRLDRVDTNQDTARYNAMIEHYHYLGFKPMAGAQIRYLICWEGGVLGAIGFGAGAWKVAPRDQWIGWTTKERERGLHRIVNNSRFLILPHIRCQNLASKVLAMASRRIAGDFMHVYGYAPMLLESFVERGRFSGHCYLAANWRRLGETTGRGKKHRRGEPIGSIKDIWVYPLQRKFRQLLQGGPEVV